MENLTLENLLIPTFLFTIYNCCIFKFYPLRNLSWLEIEKLRDEHGKGIYYGQMAAKNSFFLFLAYVILEYSDFGFLPFLIAIVSFLLLFPLTILGIINNDSHASPNILNVSGYIATLMVILIVVYIGLS